METKAFSYLMLVLVITGIIFGFVGSPSGMAMCFAYPAGAWAGLHLRKIVDNDYEDLNE